MLGKENDRAPVILNDALSKRPSTMEPRSAMVEERQNVAENPRTISWAEIVAHRQLVSLRSPPRELSNRVE